MISKYLLIGILPFLMVLPKQSQAFQSDENPLPECPGTPNCVRTSLTFESDSASVINAFDEALQDMKASLVKHDTTSNQIKAEFTIPVFGWIDDVVVQVEQTATGTIAYVRSSSREGTWDIWVNPIRVNSLKKRVKKILSS